jgi:CO/xanthine dehydrogenase Mo-binding subunit
MSILMFNGKPEIVKMVLQHRISCLSKLLPCRGPIKVYRTSCSGCFHRRAESNHCVAFKQSSFPNQEVSRRSIGVDEKRIIVQLSSVGGDFGGKGALMDVPLCYFLAKTTGRPVKMIMNYAEELMAGNPRHPSQITIKTGIKADGKIWARVSQPHK